MALPIPAGSYGIDKMHTQLAFAVTHLGISIVRGTFDTFDGTLTVGDSLDASSLSLEAEMASVNTGNSMRDNHLHGGDFFDVENHPKLSFRSTSIEESANGYRLNGELTLKGASQPVVLDATYNGSGTFPMDGSTHYGFSASGTISRSAFGVSYGVPMVSDDVKLTLEAQFVQPKAE